MYAKKSYPTLVRGVSETEHIYLTEVTSLMKGLSRKTDVEKTPRTEFCAAKVTTAVKCKQGDHRPLGEMPPLSDRAPINIQIGMGRAVIDQRRQHQRKHSLAFPVSESIACDQSSGWNLGDPTGFVSRRTLC